MKKADPDDSEKKRRISFLSRILNAFKKSPPDRAQRPKNIELDIERDSTSRKLEEKAQDIEQGGTGRSELLFPPQKQEKLNNGKTLAKLAGRRSIRRTLLGPKKEKRIEASDLGQATVKSRSAFERFAYSHFSSKLPNLGSYREIYGQSGISLIYESYLSTAFLVSAIITVPTFLVSLLLEIRLLHLALVISVIGSLVLSGIIFAAGLQLWLIYPIQRRKMFKSKLDGQLAYSFGILGVLAVSGISIERLFEKLASSESNPVLAELSKRFLRNVRIFGLDTESALREVAAHSPSQAFSKMLESIAVAFRTTGSIYGLVVYESARLFEEKREKLRKVTGNLGILAELYITLVIVGPIIFIVMMAIFSLLPSGGLPDPIFVINLIVFIGVPIISIMFVIMLDSLITKA